MSNRGFNCSRLLSLLSMGALLLGLSAPAAPAQTTKPTPVARRVPHSSGVTALVAELSAELAGPDAAERQKALDTIRERITTNPSRITELRAYWLRPLLGARLYKEADELALHSLLAVPYDTKGVEGAMTMRVRALLAAGKPTEALSAARSLFNVASMDGTADALLLLAECLIAARPTEVDLYDRFKSEQIGGATTQPVSPTTQPKATVSPLVQQIKVDAAAYEEAIAKATAEDYQGLLARGNLLLLANRPREAKVVFERMYSIARPSDLPEASECLARCMRAEDGTIGRANSWIYSIRPK